MANPEVSLDLKLMRIFYSYIIYIYIYVNFFPKHNKTINHQRAYILMTDAKQLQHPMILYNIYIIKVDNRNAKLFSNVIQ